MTQVKNLQGDILDSSQKEPQKRSKESQLLFDEWTVSASGLSEFSKSPRSFKAYKEKDDRSTSSHFKIGTAIHCKILEPDEFDERYYIMEEDAPGGNMGVFIDRYFYYLSEDFDNDLAKEMAYNESGYKTKFETVWKNFETKPELINYWYALNNSKDKIILDSKEEYIIEQCASSVADHKVAQVMLDNPLLKDDTEILTEHEILWEMKGFEFKMKSILDRVIIDKKNKVVNIIDLKTTSKNVHKFEYSYRSFAYYRQIALYAHAIMWYIENELKEDKSEWAVTSTIIAVQTTGFYETVVYAPAPVDMKIGHREIIDLLTELNWHYENDKWDYPVEYYLSGGIMPIALNLDVHGTNAETGQNND